MTEPTGCRGRDKLTRPPAPFGLGAPPREPERAAPARRPR